jgi:hypothetical protein
LISWCLGVLVVKDVFEVILAIFVFAGVFETFAGR